jgi:hypothetical protein
MLDKNIVQKLPSNPIYSQDKKVIHNRKKIAILKPFLNLFNIK